MQITLIAVRYWSDVPDIVLTFLSIDPVKLNVMKTTPVQVKKLTLRHGVNSLKNVY